MHWNYRGDDNNEGLNSFLFVNAFQTFLGAELTHFQQIFSLASTYKLNYLFKYHFHLQLQILRP